jgi:hypothetical protein
MVLIITRLVASDELIGEAGLVPIANARENTGLTKQARDDVVVAYLTAADNRTWPLALRCLDRL